MYTIKKAYRKWGWDEKIHNQAHDTFMTLREMLKKLKLYNVKPTGKMSIAIGIDMQYHHYTELYAVSPSKKAPRSKRSKKVGCHFVQ